MANWAFPPDHSPMSIKKQTGKRLRKANAKRKRAANRDIDALIRSARLERFWRTRGLGGESRSTASKPGAVPTDEQEAL